MNTFQVSNRRLAPYKFTAVLDLYKALHRMAIPLCSIAAGRVLSARQGASGAARESESLG